MTEIAEKDLHQQFASDNYAGSAACGHVYGHAGICFLAYRT